MSFKVEAVMSDHVELIIIGGVTENVKKALLEDFNALRSKGVKKVNLRIFTQSAPLKYIEGLREVLLANMIASVRLYEHDLSEVGRVLEQMVRGGKEVVVISDEEPLRSQVQSMLNSLKGKKV